MIKSDDYLLFLKFSEQRWIQNLIEGIMSFSCIGYFINLAQKSDNKEQGDDFEGFFARLKSDDTML